MVVVIVVVVVAAVGCRCCGRYCFLLCWEISAAASASQHKTWTPIAKTPCSDQGYAGGCLVCAVMPGTNDLSPHFQGFKHLRKVRWLVILCC